MICLMNDHHISIVIMSCEYFIVSCVLEISVYFVCLHIRLLPFLLQELELQQELQQSVEQNKKVRAALDDPCYFFVIHDSSTLSFVCM